MRFFIFLIALGASVFVTRAHDNCETEICKETCGAFGGTYMPSSCKCTGMKINPHAFDNYHPDKSLAKSALIDGCDPNLCEAFCDGYCKPRSCLCNEGHVQNDNNSFHSWIHGGHNFGH